MCWFWRITVDAVLGLSWEFGVMAVGMEMRIAGIIVRAMAMGRAMAMTPPQLMGM